MQKAKHSSAGHLSRERLREMLVFRNRLHLYRTTCAITGQPILSAVAPSAGFTVVDAEIWDGEQWDGLAFGRPYDFDRSFFEQFNELRRLVPMPNLAGVQSTRENSDYVNGVSYAKNCYLAFGGNNLEDCLYCQNVYRSRNIIDCTMVSDSELCYDSVDLQNCYNVKFSAHCVNCTDAEFLYGCQSCRNCYGCIDLQQREYCFYNEQVSPDEFKRLRNDLNLGSSSGLSEQKARFASWRAAFPARVIFGHSNEDVSGNFIYRSKSVFDSSNCVECESLEHCVGIQQGSHSLFHLYFGTKSELIYNCANSGINIYDLKFCSDIRMNCNQLEYCIDCSAGTSRCFGCAGLKHQSYCILNRQYSKEEYVDTVQRIKRQMLARREYGRFFPAWCSAHAYNKSEAIDMLPLTRDEAVRLGYRWEDEQIEASGTGGNTVETPSDIADVDDALLDEMLLCEKSGRPFKLSKPEIQFLKREGIALPRTAPLQRLAQRAEIYRL